MQKHDAPPAPARSLQQIRENHEAFIESGGDRKKAKDKSNNVIAAPIISIPIDQVHRVS